MWQTRADYRMQQHPTTLTILAAYTHVIANNNTIRSYRSTSRSQIRSTTTSCARIITTILLNHRINYIHTLSHNYKLPYHHYSTIINYSPTPSTNSIYIKIYMHNYNISINYILSNCNRNLILLTKYNIKLIVKIRLLMSWLLKIKHCIKRNRKSIKNIDKKLCISNKCKNQYSRN